MPKGNAGDWSPEDMRNDQADVQAQTGTEWVVEDKQFISDAEGGERAANELRNKLGPRARRYGKQIGVKKVRGGYLVTVEIKKPKK
jgi:hypothetical protein